MNQKKEVTDYDEMVLWVLAYEFSFTEKRETDAKIKRKLKAKKLQYDQQRIDLLRRLKDDSQAEISKMHKSKYYIGSHGEFADMKDFDKELMMKEYAIKYPDISKQVISKFLEYAIYLYYLR